MTKLQDIAVRGAKTFIQAAAAVLVLGTVGLPSALVVGLISAGISVAMNALNITPESIPGRAGSTFLQTFLATWAVTGYDLTGGALIAAGSAAISAIMNFVVKAS